MYFNAEAKVIPTRIFSVNNWTLKQNQPEGPSFTPNMLAIYATDEPGQASASTPMVDEIHKETLQATSGQTSFGVTDDERDNPQLITSFIAKANLGNTDPKGSLSRQQGTEKKPTTKHMFEINIEDVSQSSDDDEEEIKRADLTELVKETGTKAMDLDSPKDDQHFRFQVMMRLTFKVKFRMKLVILQSLNLFHLLSLSKFKTIELLVNSLKPELDKMLTAHDFSASIPMELKELPTKVNEISGTLGDLKKYVEQLEIEVLGELKDLPNKLQDFQASISVLTTKVASLEGLKLYIPARLLSLPSQVSSISSQLTKLRVLDAILSMLGKVVAAMDRFPKAIDPASQKAGDQSVP
ncbi:hypothetical protein Tco_0336433 [Tanacetum coccineum]